MNEMTPERFEALLAAYGADPARWPAAERGAAQAFAERARGAPMLARERRLDALLAAAGTPAPADEALLTRLLAVPGQGRPRGFLAGVTRDVRAFLAPRALAGELAALAAALLAGLWLGASSGTAEAEAVDLTAYVLGGEMELLEEERP